MPPSKRFLLRLDPRLFEALRRWAEDDLRSINAQIEFLLTDAARRAGRLPRQTTPRPRPPGDIPTDELADSDEAAEERDDATAVGPRRAGRGGVLGD